MALAARWLQLRAACARLPGVGRKTLVKAIHAGDLKAARVGGRMAWYTSDRWLNEWIEGLAEQAAARDG